MRLFFNVVTGLAFGSAIVSGFSGDWQALAGMLVVIAWLRWLREGEAA